MPRTTSGAVLDLLQRDYDTRRKPSLNVHIASANAMVTRVAACATAKGKTLTAVELELIERWLAAHKYVCIDQTYAEKTTGDAKAVYHGRTGMGLESSRYGQEAMNLDYSGCLESLNKRKTARLVWLGKPPSEQTDYEARD